MTSDVRLILTTVGDEDSARELGRSLVEEGLVACVTLIPVRSVYRWEGAVHDEREVQLILKTTPAGVEAAIDAVQRMHPYDLPEILCLPSEASEAYGAWVGSEVAP